MKDPTIVPPGTGDVLWFLDTLMEVKAGAVATGGTLAVFEQLAPPGSATPMHRHDATDEHFYVLAGEVTFMGQVGRGAVAEERSSSCPAVPSTGSASRAQSPPDFSS